MAKQIKTAFPPDLELGGNWIIEWDAVDPVTGDTVPDVVISHTSLQVAGDTGKGQGKGLPPGPYMLVPGPGA